MSIRPANVVQYRGNKAAGAVIYALDTKKFLIAKRGPDGDSPNTWCVLGGGVEAGESIEGALRRELWEEIQFRSPITLVRLGNDISGTFEYITYLGFVRNEFIPVLNEENSDFRWLSLDEMIPDDTWHAKFREFWLKSETSTQVNELVDRYDYLYNQSLKKKELML